MAGMTSLEGIAQFMKARVDAVVAGQMIYCRLLASLNHYHELKMILQTAGHDARELHGALSLS